MLEPNGRQILSLVGKDNQTKGILLPEDMPAAVVALGRAMVRNPAVFLMDESLPLADTVTLRQRAIPFIDMLKQCQKAGKEVVWGV